MNKFEDDKFEEFNVFMIPNWLSICGKLAFVELNVVLAEFPCFAKIKLATVKLLERVMNSNSASRPIK